MSNIYIEKIKNFFGNLNVSTIETVDNFYHPEAQFIDPLVKLQGRSEVKAYYRHIYQPVEEISFDFTDFIVEGEKVATFWTMHLKAPKLNKGRSFAVAGMSQIVFDQATGLVKFHRDYYDVGEFIYERIPFVCSLIKMIKRKLTKHQ